MVKKSAFMLRLTLARAETRKIEKTWKMSRFRRGSSSLLLISKQSADKTKSDLTLSAF